MKITMVEEYVIRPRRDLQARTSCEHSEISLNLNAY